MAPILRPATSADLAAFYGEMPKETTRSIVADLDGKILAVGSLVYMRGAMCGLRMEIRPEMRRYKVTLHKGALMLLGMVKKLNLPGVMAIRDASEPNSERWLTRLGFEYMADDVSGEVWIWRG